MFRLLTYVVLTVMLAISGVHMYFLIKADMLAYHTESECVRQYISSGVERNQIRTHEGTCSLK